MLENIAIFRHSLSFSRSLSVYLDDRETVGKTNPRSDIKLKNNIFFVVMKNRTFRFFSTPQAMKLNIWQLRQTFSTSHRASYKWFSYNLCAHLFIQNITWFVQPASNLCISNIYLKWFLQNRNFKIFCEIVL